MPDYSKQFLCIWGNWEAASLCSYDDRIELVPEHFFSDQLGYDQDDVDRIMLLNVGAQLDFGNHIVLRLPDNFKGTISNQ